jgi:hypothetical protein
MHIYLQNSIFRIKSGSYCFTVLCWIFRKFSIWFDFIWRLNAKDIKELENRKKKRRKGENKIKNRKGPRGTNPAQYRFEPQPTQENTERLPRALSFPPLIGGAHLPAWHPDPTYRIHP